MHATKRDIEVAMSVMLVVVTITLVFMGALNAIQFKRLDEFSRKTEIEIAMIKSVAEQNAAIHKETAGEIQYNYKRASDESVLLAQTMEQFVNLATSLRR